jgi:hypothetical protein
MDLQKFPPSQENAGDEQSVPQSQTSQEVTQTERGDFDPNILPDFLKQKALEGKEALQLVGDTLEDQTFYIFKAGGEAKISTKIMK